MIWVSENDLGKSMDKFRHSECSLGHDFPNLETLDAKIANALKNILAASDFRKKALLKNRRRRTKTDFFEKHDL